MSLKVVQGPAASASSGNLLDMQILAPLRSTESETRMRLGNAVTSSPGAQV